MPPIAPPATPAQIETLLNFLEEEKELACGLLRGSDGRIRAKRLWAQISTTLNAMGGCTKTVEQWQRVWADKKHNAKKSAGAARRSACATGGGPSEAPPLSQVDLKILSIMGDGFGEPQTEARVPAFPLPPPDAQLPDPTQNAALSLATPGSSPAQEPAVDFLQQPTSNRPSSNSRRPRVRRVADDTFKSRLFQLEQRRVQLEEQRVQLEEKRLQLEEQRASIENQRNEELSAIKVALIELCGYLRQDMMDI